MLRRIRGCQSYLMVTLEPFSFWRILGTYYYYLIRELLNTCGAGISTVAFTHVPMMTNWEWLCSCGTLLWSNFRVKKQMWVWLPVILLASMRFKNMVMAMFMQQNSWASSAWVTNVKYFYHCFVSFGHACHTNLSLLKWHSTPVKLYQIFVLSAKRSVLRKL